MPPSNHFLLRHKDAVAGFDVQTLPGVWAGMVVSFDPKNLCVVIEDKAPIVQTFSPLLKPGLPFVRLPAGIPVVGKVPKTVMGSEKLAAMLERGVAPATNPDHVCDLTDKVKRAWWVSWHTEDPWHVLIDWAPGWRLDINGNAELASASDLLTKSRLQ
jgi:hypothetical protein